MRIPGDDGTKFSLSDDLKAQTAWSARTEAGYKLQKYYLGFLITPLSVISNGTLNKNINFNGRIFAACQELKAKFRFDSYRLMYYYNIYSGNILTFGAGFTAMIWDASISLEGGGVSTEKKNTGFIPIINFALEAKLPADFLIFFGGNTLAAPQGLA